MRESMIVLLGPLNPLTPCFLDCVRAPCFAEWKEGDPEHFFAGGRSVSSQTKRSPARTTPSSSIQEWHDTGCAHHPPISIPFGWYRAPFTLRHQNAFLGPLPSLWFHLVYRSWERPQVVCLCCWVYFETNGSFEWVGFLQDANRNPTSSSVHDKSRLSAFSRVVRQAVSMGWGEGGLWTLQDSDRLDISVVPVLYPWTFKKSVVPIMVKTGVQAHFKSLERLLISHVSLDPGESRVHESELIHGKNRKANGRSLANHNAFWPMVCIFLRK